MITFMHTKEACEHKSIVYTGGNLCKVLYASLGHKTTLYMCAVKLV